jgi:16S rRNA (cytosine1402-N4)-methyltransferase
MLPHEHQSILVNEILDIIKPTSKKIIIDATLGDGGHTQSFLDKDARVVGIDQDQDALDRTSKRLKASGRNVTLVKDNFQNLTEICRQLKIKSVDGILFDLGVSTHQLLESKRGFSFQDGPLDMRMDQNLGATASDLVNGLTEKELADLFFTLGDEPRARIYAKRIAQARLKQAITTTKELADIIAFNTPRGKTHPATKIFQALRMAVNLEREALLTALPQASSLLKKGGVLCVISFHSGEDRIVKNFLKNNSDLKINNPKPITPSLEEVKQNPRSRSAKLRSAYKI